MNVKVERLCVAFNVAAAFYTSRFLTATRIRVTVHA